MKFNLMHGAAQIGLAGAIQLYDTLGDWIKGELLELAALTK